MDTQFCLHACSMHNMQLGKKIQFSWYYIEYMYKNTW